MYNENSSRDWNVVEDVPESLGVAVALRRILELAEELPEASAMPVAPVSAAHDERSWQDWWSHVVTTRVDDSVPETSADELKRMAGERWTAAKNDFAARKLGIARRLGRVGVTRSASWQRIAPSAEPVGSLRIDVFPGEAPFAQRVLPGHWLFSEWSRFEDESGLDLALRQDLFNE